MLDVVVLAAGKGTRMRSSKAKVLHDLAGKSFLSHVIDRASELNARATHLVIGHQAEQIRSAFEKYECHFVEQSKQLGTGHAVLQALPEIPDSSTVLILYGDVPLIKTQTLEHLHQLTSDKALALLTVVLDDPKGYGRIVREADEKPLIDSQKSILQGHVKAIVEQKDASAEQLEIREVNTGVMCVTAKHLKKWLPSLSNKNAQGEYYLTDIIKIAHDENVKINTVQATSPTEVMGVNSRRQQAELERVYQSELADQFLEQGLRLRDANRFDCRGTLSFGVDCEIDINCIFEGDNVLGDGVKIGANSIIKNSDIGNGTQVHENSLIENSVIEENCSVGPFARLRTGTKLSHKSKIGNFVETKNAIIGEASKVNHLSYVGDSQIGSDVNVGAGTITCNYDGVNKHKTTIGDGVFVGSNSALVAPLTIKAGVTIAAGSTITQDVDSNSLAVARSRQRHIVGWSRPEKGK